MNATIAEQQALADVERAAELRDAILLAQRMLEDALRARDVTRTARLVDQAAQTLLWGLR